MVTMVITENWRDLLKRLCLVCPILEETCGAPWGGKEETYGISEHRFLIES